MNQVSRTDEHKVAGDEIKKEVSAQEKFDLSNDVVLMDDDGERIAAMRDYVFMNLVTSAN